jgi:uncharacterized protein (DUF1015 family)
MVAGACRYDDGVATVRPFRGINFDPTRIRDLADVTCPPYDVISPTDRDRLYERHPYNIVRIVSGREESSDDGTQNKYSRACGFFRSWLWEGVIREDADPGLFVYRQAFDDPRGHLRRVWGLLGTIDLDDEILAHERTMPGPKADRLALMEAIPANLSPIYALYREEGGGISSALSSWSSEAPVADFVDDEGTRHTVWVVHDQVFHEKVASSLGGCPLLIADGHHRFETAKAYRDIRSASDGPGPWGSILTLLVDVSTQPLCILPYHRVVLRFAPDDPIAVLGAGFDVRSLGEASPEAVGSFADELWDADDQTFGFLCDGAIYSLRAKERAPDDIPAGILARRALEPLGVKTAEHDLEFTPSAEVVRSEVASGRAAGGFLIPPVGVERVWELASSGAKMPEKSTYFFPKPRDGIVIRALEPC